MSTNIVNGCGLVAGLVVLGSLSTGLSAADIPSQEQLQTGPFVIVAGNCSRSLDIEGRFKTAADACSQAVQLRKNHRIVQVVNGDYGSALDAAYSSRNRLASSIYSHGQNGWTWTATMKDDKTAGKLADMLRKSNQTVEVIRHFPVATPVVRRGRR